MSLTIEGIQQRAAILTELEVWLLFLEQYHRTIPNNRAHNRAAEQVRKKKLYWPSVGDIPAARHSSVGYEAYFTPTQAILAQVARDHISDEDYALLVQPWLNVVGGTA